MQLSGKYRYIPVQLSGKHLCIHVQLSGKHRCIHVQLSGKHRCNAFGVIPVDQAIEKTVDKDMQTSGGTRFSA